MAVGNQKEMILIVYSMLQISSIDLLTSTLAQA